MIPALVQSIKRLYPPRKLLMGWDANSSSEAVSSYILYAGSTTANYVTSWNVGNVTTYTIPILYKPQYMAVAASSASGVSSTSTELRYG